MAGRPRKPDAVKVQKGTFQPSRSLEPSMKPEALDFIPMPDDDLPEIGKQEWYKAVNQLAPLKVLTPTDLALLKSYCRHVATMDTAAKQLDTEGYTIIMQNKGGGMYPIKSPWVSIYNEASDRALKLAGQFGFTPSARTRIVVPTQPKKENGFTDFE